MESASDRNGLSGGISGKKDGTRCTGKHDGTMDLCGSCGEMRSSFTRKIN